jgi:hypothetical protein
MFFLAMRTEYLVQSIIVFKVRLRKLRLVYYSLLKKLSFGNLVRISPVPSHIDQHMSLVFIAHFSWPGLFLISSLIDENFHST